MPFKSVRSLSCVLRLNFCCWPSTCDSDQNRQQQKTAAWCCMKLLQIHPSREMSDKRDSGRAEGIVQLQCVQHHGHTLPSGWCGPPVCSVSQSPWTCPLPCCAGCWSCLTPPPGSAPFHLPVRRSKSWHRITACVGTAHHWHWAQTFPASTVKQALQI